MEVEAHDLIPNEWYYITATVREGFAGGASNKPIAVAGVGMVKTDGDGNFEFEGEGVFPNVFEEDPDVTTWRIDQQIKQLANIPDVIGNCHLCILVCSPTTKVELVDGELVLFGSDVGDDDDGDGDDDDDDDDDD